VKENDSPYLVQDVTRDFLSGCDIILDTKVNNRDYHKTMNVNLFKRPTCSCCVFAEDKICNCYGQCALSFMKINKPPTLSRKEDIQN
jgi:hypothetical protein